MRLLAASVQCHSDHGASSLRYTDLCRITIMTCIDRRTVTAYTRLMRKHTTIDLDADLVRQASEVLGTTRTTDTIHAALADVVRRRLRMEILALRPALSLEDLDAMRAHRFAEDPAPYGTDEPDGTDEPK